MGKRKYVAILHGSIDTTDMSLSDLREYDEWGPELPEGYEMTMQEHANNIGDVVSWRAQYVSVNTRRDRFIKEAKALLEGYEWPQGYKEPQMSVGVAK